MRVTSEKQIPKKINACAHAHHLGTPRIVYESPATTQSYLFLSSFAFIVSAGIIGAYAFLYDQIFSTWPALQSWMVVIIGLAWFLIGLWMLMTPAVTIHLRVFLCPKGIIYVRRHPDIIRWDDIRELSKELKMDRAATVLRGYKIVRRDGAVFLLENDLPHLDRLGGFMEREITRYLLPQALANYDMGQPLTFAHLTITPHGIIYQPAQQLLSWHEFQRISLDETTLNIYRLGDSGAWLTLSLAGFPNTWIFKGVLEYAIKQARIPALEPLSVPARPSHLVAYDTGGAIAFGPFAISRDGIDLYSQQEFLPWEEIASIGVNEHEVIIKRNAATDQWYTLPIWTITDVALLKQLIDYALFP
ncbi:DUF6585 family protein [Dictyobacter arantiisoli]|uniref:Uncharacterized protein n=1 Tax=Dictyobacter arantiisoli TaxID=2014874 RepID=A0A5A5T6R4_9CHLR|nr:DUF6585 family protein [Dictyobacter arantiisoli]GCF06713.1 hypothetical protein KDI_02770 [Dictyobacter arantiisoli]